MRSNDDGRSSDCVIVVNGGGGGGGWEAFLHRMLAGCLASLVLSIAGYGLSYSATIMKAVLEWRYKAKVELPADTPDPVGHGKEAAKEVLSDAKHAADGKQPAGVVAKQAGKRIGDKIDDAKTEVIDAIAKKAADDAAAERENLIVESRKLHVPFESSWSTDKLRAEVAAAREELVIRQPLYARAKAAGLDYLEIWPVKELEEKVKRREKWLAENVKYQADVRAWEDAMQRHRWAVQHGKNALCPRCRHAMRINPASAKRNLQCPSCQYFFTGMRALSLYPDPKPPPKPVPPKEWSLFG